MGKEIERKFLVKSDDYKSKESDVQKIRQGYFANGVRVRILDGFESKGFITFKTPTEGITRTEFEYEIPYSEAEEIINTLCKGPIIEKQRHIVYYENNKWEVDEFLGDNKGLIVAELEMPNEEYEFKNPDWLGEEVTHEKRYYNSDLTKNPFKNWSSLQNELELAKKQKNTAICDHNYEEARLRDIEKSIIRKINNVKI